MTYSQVGRPAF